MSKKNLYVVVQTPNFSTSMEVSRILSEALTLRDVESKVAEKEETLLVFTAKDEGQRMSCSVRGITFTEHSLLLNYDGGKTAIRPPVNESAITFQHNLQIAVIGQAGVGKTTMRTLCEKIINEHFKTTFPVLDINLDNFKDYPEGDLKEHFLSPERMDGFRQKIIVNIIPQTMTMTQMIIS